MRGAVRCRRGRSECGECVVWCGAGGGGTRGGGASAVSAWCGAVPEEAERVRRVRGSGVRGKGRAGVEVRVNRGKNDHGRSGVKVRVGVDQDKNN